MNNILLTQFKEAALALLFQHSNEREKHLCQKALYMTEQERYIKKMKTPDINLGILGVCFLLHLSFFGLIPCIIQINSGNMFSAKKLFGVFLFFYLSSIVMLGFTVYFYLKQRIKIGIESRQIIKEYENKRSILCENIKRMETLISVYTEVNEKVLSFLPEKYRTVYAVDYMLDLVQNERAHTLQEAIFLYEIQYQKIKDYTEKQLQKEEQEALMDLLRKIQYCRKIGEKDLLARHR